MLKSSHNDPLELFIEVLSHYSSKSQVGFGVYGSIHGPSDYTASIQLIHTGSGRVLGYNDTLFKSDGTNGTFRVMFKEPIEIMQNTNYTASATIKVNLPATERFFNLS